MLANSECGIQEYVETQKEIFCNFNEIHGRNDSEDLDKFQQVPNLRDYINNSIIIQFLSLGCLLFDHSVLDLII
jgi:hypothetical protein